MLNLIAVFDFLSKVVWSNHDLVVKFCIVKCERNSLYIYSNDLSCLLYLYLLFTDHWYPLFYLKHRIYIYKIHVILNQTNTSSFAYIKTLICLSLSPNENVFNEFVAFNYRMRRRNMHKKLISIHVDWLLRTTTNNV